MGTSEPAAKRIRFMDSEVTLDFSDSAIHHDRVLLVDGQKFHVNSSLLSQFSEFFNALFNSNFKEKNEETIELKDITAAEFDNFLRALYPIRFKVTVENLAGLMKLSNRFLCPVVWGLCLKFLKNKEEFNKFSTRELLEWSEGSVSKELKTLIEQDLIEKNIITNTSLAELAAFLIRSPNYSLDKLKDLLEDFIFKDPRRATQHSVLHLLYYSEKYDLSKVRKYLDDWFCRLPFDDPCQVRRAFLVRKLCRLPSFEVKIFDYMLQLVSKINEDKKFPPLEPENYGELELFKNLISDYLTRTELSEEDQQIILNATPEVKDFVLRNLLKR